MKTFQTRIHERMKTFIFDREEPLPIYPATCEICHRQEDICSIHGVWIEQLFVVSDGSGVFGANGDEVMLDKGDMFFVRRDVPHYYYGDDDFKTTFLGFGGTICDSIFDYYGVGTSGSYKGKNSERAELEIKEFLEKSESLRDSAMLSALTYKTVCAFFGEALKVEYTPIENVLHFLEANYSKPLTLGDIMEFYPYSKSKLCRDFSAKYGMSAFEMLGKIRLSHAKVMLKSEPHVKLELIAAACGYSDTSYFCKAYKKEFGETPRGSE